VFFTRTFSKNETAESTFSSDSDDDDKEKNNKKNGKEK
jgi:hypothetical protein